MDSDLDSDLVVGGLVTSLLSIAELARPRTTATGKMQTCGPKDRQRVRIGLRITVMD